MSPKTWVQEGVSHPHFLCRADSPPRPDQNTPPSPQNLPRPRVLSASAPRSIGGAVAPGTRAPPCIAGQLPTLRGRGPQG